MHGVQRLVLLVLLAFLATGCKPPAPDDRTPAEKFRDNQRDTVTPYGKIDPGSVKDNNGKIDYDTSDGSKWTVDPPSVGADGTPQYRPPEKRK